MKIEFNGIVKGSLFDMKLFFRHKTMGQIIREIIIYAVFFMFGMMLFANEKLDISLIAGSIVCGIIMVAPTRFNEYQHRKMLIKYLMKGRRNGK